MYLVVDVHANDGFCASNILGYLVGVDEVVFFDKCLADSSLLHVFESEVARLRNEFFLKTSSDLFVRSGLVLIASRNAHACATFVPSCELVTRFGCSRQ